MGKGWTKHGRSQAIPTLHPCKGYEGWEKSGRKVEIVREGPPYTHTNGKKSGPNLYPRPAQSQQKNTRLQLSGCPINTLSNLQKLADFFFIKQIADKEGAKFAVAGADFIEAHFVDEFLELENIVSE